MLSTAYLQTNLVSDVPGIARFTDPNLANPWGISYGPKGPFWISDNHTGLSTLYDGQGNAQSLVVTTPPPAGNPDGFVASPTGQVFNSTTDFGGSVFIFDSEDGTVSAWIPSINFTNAQLEVDNSASGAVYKGLAIGADSHGRNLLYATNFHAGTVDVFDGGFHATTVPGGFVDNNIPAGFAPFNIQAIGGKLFVTYAVQNAEAHDDVAGPGNGFVDVFTLDGQLVHRFTSHGMLNSPWGLVQAPSNFGQFSNDVLIGNFGDGRINAYDPNTGVFQGALKDGLNQPITIGGLWALKFGNGFKAGATNTLFFTAGSGEESHGLFGSIQATTGITLDKSSAGVDYLQVNLQSDIKGFARNTDPNLINPWGISYGPGGPFWVSDNNSGLVTLYDGNGNVQDLVVSTPGPGGSPAGTVGTPTGQVFNGGGGFNVSNGTTSGSSVFLFATEDGTISGWAPDVDFFNAFLGVDNSASGSVYKGLAIATDPALGTLIYASNFHNNTVDVFDNNFNPVLTGSFQDPNLPAGFAPFNIQTINGQIYVTYALQNAEQHDDVAGPGNGFVDVFNTQGVLQKRLISQGALNSPWGITMAPSNFGVFSNDLLVGNFGDGRINAFNPQTGDMVGTLTDGLGNPIVIGGLWGLKFGNAGAAGFKSTLYFTVGIGDEGDGLFGALAPIDPISIDTTGGPTIRRQAARPIGTPSSLAVVVTSLQAKGVPAQTIAALADSPALHPSHASAGIRIAALNSVGRHAAISDLASHLTGHASAGDLAALRDNLFARLGEMS